jgi:REP element-mobilizing transposase RayT
MSAPRFIVPGVTYLLSRRCFNRQLLLRPSRKTNLIFKFCLAVAAEKTGVIIHAFCVLSNHYHIVATDPHGNLPVFMHWLNEYVAKCVNADLGRWESFWAPGSYSSVTLSDSEAVIERLVYTYTNPVEAGLVRTHTDWPGAMSYPADMGGEPEVVARPEGFFRNNGLVPESAALRLVPPPAFEKDRSSWLPVLRERIRVRESEIRAKFNEKKRRFLGRRAVLRQSPFSRPDSAEPRRGLNPRVATRDKWRRIESLQRLKSFMDAYRAAWEEFCAGVSTVVFPFGTYAMRIRFGVCCGGP